MLLLFNNGYFVPEELQVLCHNCNGIKRESEVCPHQLKISFDIFSSRLMWFMFHRTCVIVVFESFCRITIMAQDLKIFWKIIFNDPFF
jgi:hypothetical protein